MARYQLESKQGHVFGVYAGKTPAHAVAAMYRDAGYRASVRGGAVKTDAPLADGLNDPADVLAIKV